MTATVTTGTTGPAASATAGGFVTDLRARLSAEKVLDAPIDLARYAHDASHFLLHPQAVVTAADAGDVERALRVAAAHGVQVEVDLRHQYPATVNDEGENAFVGQVARELFGDDRVADWDRSLTASEDFSRILQAAPGAFIGLAATAPGVDPATVPFNHSALATFDDGVLADGVTLLSELAARRLDALAEG